MNPKIPILLFADSILGLNARSGQQLYDWQTQILLNFEAGNPTAAACANFTGKTSTLFPVCALWLLYNCPRARLMYLSATGAQVKNQFFASISRFASRPAFAAWKWLETEVRTPQGGFLFGRATDTGGHIEGLHSQIDSPAALLVDEAKSIGDDVLDALSRCHVAHRLYASSTGAAFGGFFKIMTAEAHLWRTFRVTSSMCPHVSKDVIEADRQNLKDSVFAIKHDARFLYDEGDSMISLEHVRALIENPPEFAAGPRAAFCDFAGAGDESTLGLCEGNRLTLVEAWRSRDTMASVGRFLNHFRRLRLSGYEVGGDQGFGHQLMDRMSEEGFSLRRFNNGAQASRPDLYFNLSSEWWSMFGQLVERRQILIPAGDEKLIAQLTSRRKLYDSKGRERIEPKDELRSRGCESPDRADALIGAAMMRLAQDRFAFDAVARQAYGKAWKIAAEVNERLCRDSGYVDWSALNS
jgi:phage terminase large subunit